jgi:hypothetical protein
MFLINANHRSVNNPSDMINPTLESKEIVTAYQVGLNSSCPKSYGLRTRK